jgi:hypothetical protein
MAMKWLKQLPTSAPEEHGPKDSSGSKNSSKSGEPLKVGAKDLSQSDPQVPSEQGKHPLLESVLAVLKRPKQALYTYKDAEVITGESIRTLQKRAKEGLLTVRRLGKFRFLNQDLESFFENSAKKSK